MLSMLMILSAVVVVAARPSWNELHNYSFEQFVKDFKYDYKESEIDMRRSLFLSELGNIIIILF